MLFLGKPRADSSVGWPPHFPVQLQSCPFKPYSANIRGGTQSAAGSLEVEPAKAQAVGDCMLIGYLAHPWLTPSQIQEARGGSGSVPQHQSWGIQVETSQI